MKLNFPSMIMLLFVIILTSGCSIGQGGVTVENNKNVSKTPAVDKDTGGLAVTVKDQATGKPVAFEGFHLAELLPFEGEFKGAAVPALDPLNSPKAESDADGQVVISKITPNRYAFVMMTPHGPIMLKNIDTGEDIIVEIKAGEILDLGSITVEAPRELVETVQP